MFHSFSDLSSNLSMQICEHSALVAEFLEETVHNNCLKFTQTAFRGVEYSTRWSGPATDTNGACPKSVIIWHQVSVKSWRHPRLSQYL